MTVEDIRERLRGKLESERIAHCERTADTARELAVKYGANPDKAYLAGLLHDCAKALPADEILLRAQASGMALSLGQIEEPFSMLHGQVGGLVAREEYGVEDSDVLQAISRHQSGAADMTLLDNIVRLADGIEPRRGSEAAKAMRELAQTGVEEALLHWFRSTMPELVRRGFYLEPGSAVYYNQLIHAVQAKRQQNE